MPSIVAQILSRLPSKVSLLALRHAIFDEDCDQGDVLDALGRFFVKVAASGPQAALRERDLRELKAVEAILEALRRKRDVRTLFCLACASRIPGYPTDLSERLLRAGIEAEDPRQLYELAVEALDSEAPEPARTATVNAAASAILHLAQSNFVPAFATSASLLREGEGVPRDPAAAEKWYNMAAIPASVDAADNLRTVGWAYEWLLAGGKSTQVQFDQFCRHMVAVAHDSALRIMALAPGCEIWALVVAPSDRPVFVGKGQGKRLWVRSGRSTVDQMKKPDHSEYIKRHWSSFRTTAE